MARETVAARVIVPLIVAIGGTVGAIYGFANPGETIGGGLRSFPGVVFGAVCAVLAIIAVAILVRSARGGSSGD